LRHYICLRRPTIGHRFDAGATADLTVSSLDAITDRLRMVALQSETEETKPTTSNTVLGIGNMNSQSSDSTEIETELLISDLQTMLNQLEL
jgi:hypothetical protein